MKKLFLSALFFCLCVSAAFAQGTRYDGIVLLDTGRPASGASVKVCSTGSTGNPCSPAATIYSDLALTSPIASSTATSDSHGNFHFYAACGQYDLAFFGSGLTGYVEQNVQIGPCNAGAGAVAATGALLATGGGILSGNFAETNTGTNTTGSTLPSTVTAFIGGLHGPFNANRSTTESAQPDEYAPIVITNYQPSGGSDSSGKTKPVGIICNGIYNSTGEHGCIYTVSYSGGSGDNVTLQSFAYGGGPNDDNGGEGVEALRGQADSTQLSSFTATVSSASNNGSTFTINYTSPTNEVPARGPNRWLIRTDGGTYTTGTISSFSGTGTITAVGSGTGWIAGLGAGAHTDICLAVNGDTLSGRKFVVPITSVTDDTHLVLSYVVNTTNQSWPSNQTGAYTIYKCSQISDASAFGSVTVTNGYTGWGASQTIETPVDYRNHVGGLLLSVQPAIPWGGSYPTFGWRVHSDQTRAFWAGWVDSTTKLNVGIRFDNTWGADPGGNSSGGNGIDFINNPANILASHDNTTATNIFNNLNQADTFTYNPSTRLFSFATLSANKFLIDPQTGNIAPASAGGATLGTAALPWLNVKIGNAATNNATLAGTFAQPTNITFPDSGATATVGYQTGTAVLWQACSGTASSANTLLMQWAGGACTSSSTAGELPSASAGTIKNLRVRCGTGGSTAGSGIFTIKKNNAASTVTCTTGTGTTCNDVTHSFAVAAGDTLQIQYATGATETLADCVATFEKQ